MTTQYKRNKSELTRLRRQQKMYNQFLPVLKLKKEQLQSEHIRLKRELAERQAVFAEAKKAVASLVPLLAERLPVYLDLMARPRELVLVEESIAGVKVRGIGDIVFPDIELARFGFPPWVNRALPRLRELARQNVACLVVREKYDRIGRELRKATQKVNLFEEVLIPETREAVRRIEITIGDQEVAAVCRGKIAKAKQLKAMSAEVGS